MILQELWSRAQGQHGLAQETLILHFKGANLPLSAAVVKRMLRGERRPRLDAHQVVSVLLRFFAERRVLCTADEVDALGQWFDLPPGAALNLLPRVKHTNLDVTLNEAVFQKPEAAYRRLLDSLGAGGVPYVALEGPPGSGKTTLAGYLGRNPLLGIWYDVVFYGRSPSEAGWHADDEAALLETLQAFLWTLDPDHSPVNSLAAARSSLRQLLRQHRALFILDDVADGQVLPRLFVREAGHGLLAVVASGTVLQDAGLHLQQVSLEGWSDEQARRYVGAVLGRSFSEEELEVIDELNEWIAGLPLGWLALSELLFYEDDWPAVADELKDAGAETARVRAVLARLWRRLPEEERHLLETWGVFAPHAPADPPAVAAVAGLGEKETWAGLRSLHQRHLLRYAQGAGRFELHPILHSFARDKLEKSGRWHALAERHAEFYVKRIRTLRDEQNSPTWASAVQKLLPDLPNVRLGQAWAAEHGSLLTVDYFLNLAPYLVASRDLTTYTAWGQAALPVLDAQPQAFPALERYTFYGQLPDPDPARRRAHLERALAIAREELSAVAYQVYLLCRLARFLYVEMGQAAEAGPLLAQAQALAAARGSPSLETYILAEEGRFALFRRDRAAVAALTARLPVEPPAMHPAGLSGAHYHGIRADLLRAAGRWEEAIQAYSPILTLHEAIGDEQHGAEVRLRRALCRARLSDEAGAGEDLAWVQARLDELSPIGRADYHLARCELALLRGDGPQAQAALQALAEGQGEEPDPWLARLRPNLALDGWLARRQVLLALGQVEEARAAGDQAQAIAQAKGFTLDLEEPEADRDRVPVLW